MGGDRARGAAELRQAWKPGLSQRTAFRSDSDPGHSGQAAEAGCWKELLQQLQRFRRKESSDIFTEKKKYTSASLPLLLQLAVSKHRKEGSWLYTHEY